MNNRSELVDALRALRDLMECPRWLDEATVAKGGIDAHPEQVVFNMSVGYLKIKRAKEIVDRVSVPASPLASSPANHNWYCRTCERPVWGFTAPGDHKGHDIVAEGASLQGGVDQKLDEALDIFAPYKLEKQGNYGRGLSLEAQRKVLDCIVVAKSLLGEGPAPSKGGAE